MKLRRFTKPQILKQISHRWLREFFGKFSADFETCGAAAPLAQPAEDLDYLALARWLMSTACLPTRFLEALRAIDEFATVQGQEELELAMEGIGMNFGASNGLTPAEMALRAWLAHPEWLARQYNQRRMLRLTAFEYFNSSRGSQEDRPMAVSSPNLTQALAAAFDPWFQLHNRGEQTTRVELYAIESEFWFLIRHGDTMARRASVEQQRTEILHFRPERDDVVVFSPEQDEIRVNARTRGEKELYRKTFGLILFGDPAHFRAGRRYTLEPLRSDGPAALDAAGLEGILKITLREIQVAWGNAFHNVITSTAADLFASAAGDGEPTKAIPEEGELTQAAFDLQFSDCVKCGSVQVRPPNILKLSRDCDARRVGQWLAKRGFRVD